MMSSDKLLIVEDNDVMREGLEEMLTLEGFTVVSARDGVDGLSKMEASRPDLILADIAMPEMDGFEFFNAVRSVPDWITIPFVFLTARAETVDVIAGKDMGAEDYLIKPVSQNELLTTVRARVRRTRQLKMAQLKQAYQASLTALAKAIELRDRYTGGHIERVTDYSLAVGKQLGMSETQLETLCYGAILHDIGKIHIRESILTKKEALDETEIREIRKHPGIGSEMILDIPYLSGAVEIIKHHHEHWDGSGYPDGLKGEAIPHGARIVALTDAFDAMITERPYNPAHSTQDAYQEIQRCSGRQYDPGVVSAFNLVWEAGIIQAIVQTHQQ
jgi:putative two-component system response regulator